MITLTAAKAKAQFLSLLRKTNDLHETFAITHNGQPYAVIMSNDEYEGLLETMEILKDKALAKRLLKSIKDADEGKTISFEKAIGRPQRR
jgi:antitoxin YefM